MPFPLPLVIPAEARIQDLCILAGPIDCHPEAQGPAASERSEDGRDPFVHRRAAPSTLTTPAIRRCRDLDFIAIDELPESGVASSLNQAGYFLATALGEQFGLPALEAMAAGCVVLSVPVRGGMEYLRDGDNCLLVEPDEIASRLHWISRPEQVKLKVQIAQRARATAADYHPQRHLKRLHGALSAGLREALS